jgi:hypothetical protein
MSTTTRSQSPEPTRKVVDTGLRRAGNITPAATLAAVTLAVFVGPWLVWCSRIAQAHGVIGWHLPLGIALWSITPVLAVAVLATGGMPSLRELGRRIVRWRVSGRCYLFAILTPPLIATVIPIWPACGEPGAGICVGCLAHSFAARARRGRPGSFPACVRGPRHRHQRADHRAGQRRTRFGADRCLVPRLLRRVLLHHRCRRRRPSSVVGRNRTDRSRGRHGDRPHQRKPLLPRRPAAPDFWHASPSRLTLAADLYRSWFSCRRQKSGRKAPDEAARRRSTDTGSN